MAVAPVDLQRIAAHQLGALRVQGLLPENRQTAHGLLCHRSRLIAGCAGTLAAQVAIGIRALMAIRPMNRQSVVAGSEFDLRRGGGHEVTQAISVQLSAKALAVVYCESGSAEGI